MKKFFLIFSSFLFFPLIVFVNPPLVNAHDTCTDQTRPASECSANLPRANCRPHGSCGSGEQHWCCPEELPPPTSTACGNQGGECRRIRSGLDICPDGFNPTPVGGYGELGCSATQVCCTPLITGCNTWNPITRCSSGTRCPDAPTTCCVDTADCPVFTPGSLGGSSSGGGGGNALCPDKASINTAIGCIPVNSPNAFAKFIISWGIGIAGGIAFLLIVFAGFQITTSGGDPKKLQAGRELLTAAIAGLLLLIFSVFILRLVGVNILGLPQFGG